VDSHFIPDANYNAVIAAILKLEPCAFIGKVTFDQIAIALGEIGNIWPEGMKDLS